ncbi:MAG TPA: septal ring lytic transglycosylase RlpA family protein [Melioribacteraceae bacterium]|nr:septal ring lytic transglycosylase RlpA family protein [Melioribacteraceae bacterium]
MSIACNPIPRYLEKGKDVSYNYDIDTAKTGEIYIGMASYYADKFHGRQTSNGEIYNMYDLTTASPNLPFGSILRITNLKNNRAVIVRVNDRMPPHPERIIDLSYGAAEQLDMLKDGVVKVQIEVLELGN